ncbi:LysM peptidoglycan-binding domain-containing protein [Oscillochloris sp. ZM17-4]|uniref:LysM peptidoglycan-binding domain-containing protein n=1 Tax=Oscillochloris sp. ZM17-4 TaxID=2866714 RepID=UPI001C739409|nr:LysM peptidoglycan-binding domain-containing protein [Oscillochloris sp. ZM17-4]MBX0330513.1 LysM peptidoglycan-binding domain-containing protein [Oscillochloris sp. ZM17-4]
MICTHVRQLLDIPEAEDLIAPVRAIMDAHLGDCPRCKAYSTRQEQQRLLASLLASPLAPARPARAARRLAARVRAHVAAAGLVAALGASMLSGPARAGAAPVSGYKVGSVAVAVTLPVAGYKAGVGTAATPGAATDPIALGTLAPAPTTYVVKPGDSLSAIALAFYGNANAWPTIYDANQAVIGPNPGLIFPGQVLSIPPAMTGTGTPGGGSGGGAVAGGSYTVKPGDTLSAIALAAYGNANAWPTIHNANQAVIGPNPGLIFPGQVLSIPPAMTGAGTPGGGAGGGAVAGGSYTVKPGDTLSAIALAAYGNANAWPTIHNANQAVIGPNPNLIFPGQVLSIPA